MQLYAQYLETDLLKNGHNVQLLINKIQKYR